MRGDLRDFEVERPRTLAAALARLAAPERPCPLAGGSDLYVAIEAGRAPARRYLDLSRLDELRGIVADRGALRLGALTTYTDLRRSRLVARRAPVLAEMAATVGAAAIQNRGTLGGSLGNASPASDPAPVLLVLDAEIELAARRGRAVERRRVPIARFFTSYRETAMRADELVVAIRIPAAALDGWRHAYRKVGARRAQAISKLVVATAVRTGGRPRRFAGVRIALGSVAPVSMRATATEELLLGGRLDDDALLDTARRRLREEIAPIDDLRSTAAYRARVAGNLLEEMLRG